jgi:hypothetical protein
VLENPDIAYAQKITHRLTPGGQWHARIEGKSGVVEYTLTRMPPLTELAGQPLQLITGRFTGVMAFRGKEDKVIFVFDAPQGAPRVLVSAPDRGIIDAPAKQICYDPPQLKFTLEDNGQRIEFLTIYNGAEISGKTTNDKMPITIWLTKDKHPPGK